MEPWRVCMLVVANLHCCGDVKDTVLEPHKCKRSDPDPHQSERSVRILIRVKGRIRIRIRIMRVRKTGC